MCVAVGPVGSDSWDIQGDCGVRENQVAGGEGEDICWKVSAGSEREVAFPNGANVSLYEKTGD